MMRKLIVTLFLAFFAIFTSASRAAGAPAEIKIGTLYADSGTFAAISMPVYRGLKLWVDQTNAEGGVFVKPYNKKIPIKLIAYDDQSNTATAATLYNQLITQDKADVLVSDFGSVLTSVAVPIAKNNKMLLFDPTGTGASFFTAWYAVMPASECGATAAGSTPSGSRITERSSARTKSAKPPSRVRPVKPWRVQRMSSPRRQETQRPQVTGG